MGVMGFTGERTKSGHGRRRQQRRGGGRAAGQPERLEGRLLFSGTLISSVVDVTWKGHTVKAIQDQWIVATTHAASFETLATQQGFNGVTSLADGYYQFSSTDTVTQIVKLAAAHPLALGTVQPNMVSTIQNTLPDDAELSKQWGLDNTGQLESYDANNNGIITPYNEQSYPTGLPAGVTTDFPTTTNPDENFVGTVGTDIDAQQAWDVTTGSSSVVVAVLDTGIDLTHPDLIGNIWTNPLDTTANGENGDGYAGDVNGYNFVDGTADVTDDNGHGTSVAGVIGASGNNGIGVTGVDWNVKMVPVKVADADGLATDATIIAGINYVINLRDHGINVVVMNESFTGSSYFPVDALESEATKQAGKAGILSVASAGNGASNLDSTTAVPAQSASNLASVITVAAIDNQGKLASFSNYGAQRVDIAAPGVNIYTTFPTTQTYTELANQDAEQLSTAAYYLAPPLDVSYGYDSGSLGSGSSADGNLTSGVSSGTSLAAPFVTGTIALEAAANPSATPAQLKTALLESRTYDPNLAAANGVPAKVATSGYVNAYQAVLAIKNVFVGTDTTRQGSWVGYYGSQGAYIVGDSSAFPTGFVNVTTSGGAPVIVDNSTKNPAALQRATDPTDRLSAYQGSATSETISLSFTDGQKHRTRLYVLDPDHKKRTEVINIVDANTGLTVDSEAVSNFSKGEYLTWDLQGNVNIVISSVSGGAAFSGLFFDTPDVTPDTFYNLDANTFGTNWRNTYGSQGDEIFGDVNTDTLPDYVSLFSTVGGSLDVLRSTTKDRRGLQQNVDLAHNIEAYESSTTSEDINVGFSDAVPTMHTVTLYLADYNNQKRSERVQAIDSATGDVLVTQDVTSFKDGVFVSFNVDSATTFRVTNTGGPNAVVSGVFFDAPFGENGHFEGTDLSTGGNWTSTGYGQTASFIVGSSFPGVNVPADARLSLTGGTEGILPSPTKDNAALVTGTTNDGKTRIAAYEFTTSSMTLNYVPSDTLQHQLALYFADFQNDHRVESVTVYDATTNAVLSKQVLSNFRQGKYMIYDVNGPVRIVIQNMASPNAVLSGVFLD